MPAEPQPLKPVPEREEGIVDEALPALSFRVRMKDGRLVLGHLAGKLRLHHIRVLAGDKVLMELSPDGARGRIVRRL
jgi:translation initiation factor IF-1